MGIFQRRTFLIVLGLAVPLLGGLAWFLSRPVPGDPRLRGFVTAKPPVPIVFTSRTGPASLVPASSEGEGFVSPGQRSWTEREGRLRVLTPAGEVHELTHGKLLPDGGTIVDVLSPSVTLDGQRVLFAGIKGGDGAGRFRIYTVGIDGSNLQPVTGEVGDPGAVALPPLRYADETREKLLSPEQRKQTDYDDVDPIDVGHRRIVLASSRTPDLGYGHARRATNLWEFDFDSGKRRQLTSNRNNDRWPAILTCGDIFFSLWSRNTEVVSPDRTEIRRLRPGEIGFTQAPNVWLGAFVDLAHTPRMGHLIKTPDSVWRGRPLFNGQIVYMTLNDAVTPTFTTPAELRGLRIVQGEPGLIANAPTGSPAGSSLPRQESGLLQLGPTEDAQGRSLAQATPSPCPPDLVVFAGAAFDADGPGPDAKQFGLYLCDQDWAKDDRAAPIRLFDDPEMVDAEPVAAYPRAIEVPPVRQEGTVLTKTLKLESGRVYTGPVGQLRAENLHQTFMDDVPGQITDIGDSPIFVSAPRGTVAEIRVWAAHRDRFDDPIKPRIPGEWEPLVRLPVDPQADFAVGDLPLGSPTVLAGFDSTGKIAQWSGKARDIKGHAAQLVAFAGDHYSGVAPGGFHFCTGCHTGHSTIYQKNFAEKLGP